MLRNPALAVAFLTVLAGPVSAAEEPLPVERAAIPAVRHAGDGFRLSYDVYKSGFRALSLNFDVALGDDSYRPTRAWNRRASSAGCSNGASTRSAPAA